MDSLEVSSISFGPFTIGCPLDTAMTFLQQHGMKLRNNPFTYNSADPYHHELEINILQWGVRLVFDPHTQRLYLIDVYDLTKLILHYGGKVFNQPGNPSTSNSLSKVFGPTFDLTFEASLEGNILQYPGLCFVLPNHSNNNNQPSKHSLTITSSHPLKVTRLLMYYGNDITKLNLQRLFPAHSESPDSKVRASQARATRKDSDIKAQSEELKFPSLTVSHTDLWYGEPVLVFANQGILLTRRRVFLALQQHRQDVIAELGPPNQIYTRDSVNQLHIHTRPQASSSASSQPCDDYFFNYFAWGFDVLFCGRTHR